MTLLLALAFFGVCALLVWPAVRDPARCFEFPFFMGAAFLGFQGPQVLALLSDPDAMQPEVLQRGLLMLCLCAAACGLGYRGAPTAAALAWFRPETDWRRLFHAALVMGAVGAYFFYKVRTHPDYWSSQWTGSILRYSFVATVGVPAVALCALLYLRRPQWATALALAVALAGPLPQVVFGRRAMTFTMLLSGALALHIVRGWRPTRTLLIAGTLAGVLFIFAIPAYRAALEDREVTLAELAKIDLGAGLAREAAGAGDNASETEYGFHLMQAATESGRWEYGSLFWNQVVGFYIPAQFVGRERKEALLLEFGAEPDSTELRSAVELQLTTGLTLTGAYTAYKQFWFFGALLFALYARFYRYFWEVAKSPGYPVATMIYPAMVVHGMHLVTHHVAWASSQFVFFAACAFATYLYARKAPDSMRVRETPARARRAVPA